MSSRNEEDLDARLESLSVQPAPPSVVVEEEDDTFNSETFGTDSQEITNDFDFFQTTHTHLNQEIADRRHKRIQRQQQLSRYDNLMTQQDKDFIVRIQVSQLLTDDPAADDFYCHMYRLSHQQQQPEQPTPGQQYVNQQSSITRMQQQVQRIVNEAKRRPKHSHVKAEGALGKISVNSARNPKQVIQVQKGTSTSQASQATVTMGEQRKQTLRQIEAVYTAVLRMEQLIREQTRLPHDQHTHPSVQQWITNYQQVQTQAWLHLDASQPILNTYPHPLARFLSFAKGKRIIPRLLNHLSADQVLAFITTVIANYESLDVCRLSNQQGETTRLFQNTVMSPILGFLAATDTSLQIVNGLLALFMERNNITWVARTNPAQAFLTMLLGRTAGLRNSENESQAAKRASLELYNHMFAELQGNLASIFPNAVGPLDDLNAWQLLAALAMGASLDQQHVLVTQVRQKVLDRVQLANSGQLPPDMSAAVTANVNLFLNALGLDASQIT